MRFDADQRWSLCRNRLMKRREVVLRTLDYLDDERKMVDANRQWTSPSAQRSRRRLLDEIHGRYDTELKTIDVTLRRLNYGG